MQKNNIKKFITNAVFTFFAIFGLSSFVLANFDEERKAPELPAGCSQIQVPAGNRISFHTYAIGIQVYRWNGSSWDFVAPSARLFADSGYRGLVGDHYAGPTWESNSGSKVVARRVDGCSPSVTAIPWLLLQTVTTEGKGVFANTTFIHRVNTVGGQVPAEPGIFPGVEQKVPYTAEYYFYRAQV
jgi:hypothetical protein